MDLRKTTQNAAIVATVGALAWGCSEAESTTSGINSDHSNASVATAVDRYGHAVGPENG